MTIAQYTNLFFGVGFFITFLLAVFLREKPSAVLIPLFMLVIALLGAFL